MTTAHPRKNTNKTLRTPTGFHIANACVGSGIGGCGTPFGVRINSCSYTWGAPQSGDPRLCCETRSGLNHTILPANNPSRRCPLGLGSFVPQVPRALLWAFTFGAFGTEPRENPSRLMDGNRMDFFGITQILCFDARQSRPGIRRRFTNWPTVSRYLSLLRFQRCTR